MSSNSELTKTVIVPAPTPPSRQRPAPVLVAGSGVDLTSETNIVLRDRLRAVSMLLFLGFAAFFVRNLMRMSEFLDHEWPLFWAHCGVMLVMGLTWQRMCQECVYFVSKLRITEWVVFGSAALFFGVYTHTTLMNAARFNGIKPIAVPWIILIFTYALFIPNSWRRAAFPIGVMAIVPLIMIGTAPLVSESFREFRKTMSENVFGFPDLAMMMFLTAAIALRGVYTINTLRKEAFEAKRLGHYRLSRSLGAGGMGEVYLAEHLLLKRPCAIKVIRSDQASDPTALARFEREVRATAQLTHWNTVEIFDYGHADDGTFYYVMEYLPGLNLEQLVSMHGPLAPARVIHLLTQTCEALREAHGNGLLHRDLKPANIFAARRGGIYDVAKLLDFGLARPISTLSGDGVTQEGSITGSPLFMSPEQTLGEALDERSDIYSLGMVAWYLLTGRAPFAHENPMKVLLAQSNETPEPPSAANPEISDELDKIVMQCLEKNPADRIQSVAELRDALLRCPSAGEWTSDQARHWWKDYGCPKKKELDAEVLNEPEPHLATTSANQPVSLH